MSNINYGTMKRKFTGFHFLLFVFGLFMASMPAMAQNQNLKGTVTDASTDEALVGVTIQVKGTAQGVATDLEGNFSLSNINPEATLLVSSIGYRTAEVKVSVFVSNNLL